MTTRETETQEMAAAAQPQAGLALPGLRSLTPQESRKIVDWMLNATGSQPPACWRAEGLEIQPLKDFEPQWAVLQCMDSLVWCVRDGDQWLWAHRADPAVRKPRAEMLMEARLFGASGEVMVWPAGDGSFAGRWLKAPSSFHGGPGLPPGRPDLRPLKEQASFQQGDDKDRAEFNLDDHFTLREEENGRITITPRGTGVEVAQHLHEDSCGIVRVVATQFLRVMKSEKTTGG